MTNGPEGYWRLAHECLRMAVTTRQTKIALLEMAQHGCWWRKGRHNSAKSGSCLTRTEKLGIDQSNEEAR